MGALVVQCRSSSTMALPSLGWSCMIGLAGLATDVQTMQQKLTFRTNMYKLREEREMKPSTFSNVVSSVLYERRFGPYFVEPVVAGLEDGKPFLCAMDLI